MTASAPTPHTKHVAVVGSGYAGLACAVQLVQQGHRVSVFESSHIPGGRARRINPTEQWPHALDNGQHILIGAYSHTLRMMRTVGLDPEQVLLRMPFFMQYLDAGASAGPQMQAARLPAPLHLAYAIATAKHMPWAERFAMLRLVQHLKRQRFTLPATQTVAQLMQVTAQPARLVQRVWRPICVSALNTELNIASAQVFATVLRDSLLAAREASDFLVPRVDLSAMFAQPAVDWLGKNGAAVYLGHTIRSLTLEEAPQTGSSSATPCVRLGGHAHTPDAALNTAFDAVVLATHPAQTLHLLQSSDVIASTCADTIQALRQMQWRSITTVYLQLQAPYRLPRPFMALADDPAVQRYGQFVFDRKQIAGGPQAATERAELSVVISADGPHNALDREALAQAVYAQLKAATPDLPALHAYTTVVEKRATYACSADLTRPSNQTAHPSIVLAGDYTNTGYPATIEGAVRSGLAVTLK